MKVLHAIAFVLVFIGAVNWGLVGINESWNVVDLLLGRWDVVEKIVYILVGVSGLFLAITHRSECKHCVAKADAPTM